MDNYFPGLFNEQLVDGKNYQFPWYQGIAVELINKEIYDRRAGLKVEDFPKTFDGLPALCQTIKDKTGKLCDIRLTVNDLLAQMVYEGGVDVINDDGNAVHLRLRRRASRGSRCTSTWSRPAPSTRPSSDHGRRPDRARSSSPAARRRSTRPARS